MITARQAEMKTNMKAMKALVSMLKGETPYDTAAVQAAAKSITDAHGRMRRQGRLERLLADRRHRQDRRQARDLDRRRRLRRRLEGPRHGRCRRSRPATDEASFKAAFPALGAACKGCHEKFRQAE